MINPTIPNSDKGPVTTRNFKNKNKEPKEPAVSSIPFSYISPVFSFQISFYIIVGLLTITKDSNSFFCSHMLGRFFCVSGAGC